MTPSTDPSEPSLVEAGFLPARPPGSIRELGEDILEFIYFIYGALVLLSIGFAVGIVTVVLVCLVFVLACGLPLGFTAAYGAIIMLVGNGILRAVQLEHYTDNTSAASIGATGAIITSLFGGIFMRCIPKDENGRPPFFISLIVQALVSILTGTIGCAILAASNVDLGPIDVLHAAYAGALGGTIVGPVMVLILPILFGAIYVILSPLWEAVTEVLRWIAERWTKSLDALPPRRINL